MLLDDPVETGGGDHARCAVRGVRVDGAYDVAPSGWAGAEPQRRGRLVDPVGGLFDGLHGCSSFGQAASAAGLAGDGVGEVMNRSGSSEDREADVRGETGGQPERAQFIRAGRLAVETGGGHVR